MKPKSLLLIIGLLSLFSLSCKKSQVYPAGTATVKYVITWSTPLIPDIQQHPETGIFYTANGDSLSQATNLSGNTWAQTVTISTDKGNAFNGSTVIHMNLLAQLYVNGVLQKHVNQPTTAITLGGTIFNEAALQLQWVSYAPNPL
jgi:hypothetical protein